MLTEWLVYLPSTMCMVLTVFSSLKIHDIWLVRLLNFSKPFLSVAATPHHFAWAPTASSVTGAIFYWNSGILIQVFGRECTRSDTSMAKHMNGLDWADSPASCVRYVHRNTSTDQWLACHMSVLLPQWVAKILYLSDSHGLLRLSQNYSMNNVLSYDRLWPDCSARPVVTPWNLCCQPVTEEKWIALTSCMWDTRQHDARALADHDVWLFFSGLVWLKACMYFPAQVDRAVYGFLIGNGLISRGTVTAVSSWWWKYRLECKSCSFLVGTQVGRYVAMKENLWT